MENTEQSICAPLVPDQSWVQMLLHWQAEYLPKLFLAAGIFFFFWLVGWLLNCGFRKAGSKTSLPGKRDVLILIGQSIYVVMLIVGLITALGTFGVNVGAMVAGLGLAGFALGFALRDALSNLLAGVLLLFYQPFKHGDVISVAGHEGYVTGIDLRYTTLAGENKTIMVPNSLLFTNTLVLKQPPPESKNDAAK
jgi:small-conductance mechanosensitive channel